MRQRKFLWFLFGLGVWLQLFGSSLCFTEIFVYAMSIPLFASEVPHMRRNGIMPFFNLSLCLVGNAALSCFFNHCPFASTLRGMAVVCLIPCTIVVAHWMLRKDMANFKWCIVGGALSDFLSTFFFQQAVSVNMNAGGVRDGNTAEAIMSGPLWLVGQVGHLLTVFPKGWYLSFPTWLSAGLPVVLAAFALFTSASGRGTAIRSLCGALIILLGGKDPDRIRRRVCKNFWFLAIAGLVTVFAFKQFYQTAATSGWLGEKAQKKYEQQTRGNKSMAALIMGGRGGSFVGLLAAFDHPLFGLGPWARDTAGYHQEFIARYGNAEDAAEFAKFAANSNKVGLIPCHAYLTEFWCWYGIFGLVFWLYVIFVLLRYLRQDCYAVPQWFMWLAAAVPNRLWDIFFSPFSGRVGVIMAIVACLLARAVRKNRLQLPPHMLVEIAKARRR